ncbi:MAG: indole-3-glycerol-phosphate synthase [Candidatus Melainabacteria bacterium]|nr:indole-3-glycerol-phosphate synthase [Candidatus Melainabacteria bacterium]
MTDYLTQILERKEQEAKALPEPISFKQALQKEGLAVIAEIKRRSPSKGTLNAQIDPATLARQYVAGGAAAISVLTDTDFDGTLRDLQEVIDACPGTPVLRKDFIIDLKQLYETARTGAHAVLLIAGALKERLPKFISACKEYGLEALVEVHDAEELALAQMSGAEIIGVNNRNLTTFHVSLDTAIALGPQFQPHIVKVAESGIQTALDASLMRRAGYDAILVGETLVKAQNPETLIRGFSNAH